MEPITDEIYNKNGKRKCMLCGTDGLVNTGGFQYEKCWNCQGDGYFYESDAKVSENKDQKHDQSSQSRSQEKIDKRSKEYKDAISQLEKKGMSKEQAEKIFKQEYEKL